ncbi:FCD domain-containing protein [Bordetella petrii]|nr:FCD domain-containing protein [Bordetella petrii]
MQPPALPAADVADRLPPATELQGKMEKIVRHTLSDRVYADLKELLQSGEMEPGQRFTLRGLAATVGTSAMPVREAVGRLAAEQALEVLPNRAIRVPIMTRDRFLELRTIRIQLEGLAIVQAAQHRSEAELAEIQAYEQAFLRARGQAVPDGRQAVRANKGLHFAIYRAARMPALLQIIEGLWLQVGPVLNYDLASSPRRLSDGEAHVHHANMVAAIARQDGAAARDALVADLTSASEFILARDVLP